MQKLILIGGKAGLGASRTSVLLGKTLSNMGYYVFNYRDYPSLIRGGHNFNVLKVSDKPVYSHENSYDVILAFDQKTIDMHEDALNKDGFVLADDGIKSKKLVGVDIKSILKKLGLSTVFGNNILLGALFKALGLPMQKLLETLKGEFPKKADEITKTVEEGYKSVEEKMKLDKPKSDGKYFLTGNEAVGAGAIVAGLDAYFAYPMTPATPVLHFLASKQAEHNITVVQPENEIAVVNASLGANYAGAMSMVGTSGGGFALMVEALSLQGMSEIPLVVYLASRPAPSTGVPTYTGQGDLKFAVNAGHGEFPRVVVAPGDAKEAFYRTMEALYLAYKYRTLSIILGDKHVGESNYTFDDFQAATVKPDKFLIKPSADYKSYALTDTGVSPRAVPGYGVPVLATSYEHDEYGHTREEAEWAVKMTDKRLKKWEHIRKEVGKLKPVSVYGKGENLIISWGSTKGAIIDALDELKGFRFMQVSYITPFPSDEVKKEIGKSKKVVLVENNATGMLGEIIAEQTGCAIKDKLLKYDGRPFTSRDVVDGIGKVVK
jgi:2-oxoglutarate ferredoxin oxidoreductase subunit alpha